MQVVVASFDAAARAALQARTIDAGLAAPAVVDSSIALGRLLESDRLSVVVTGAHWPEVESFMMQGAASNTPVALLLDDGELRASHPAVRRGASAVLPWELPAPSLAAALEAVAVGLLVLPTEAPTAAPTAQALQPRVQALSARERDILALVANGLPTKQVARRLALSPNTIKHHLASAFAKLGARTRAGALSEAIRRGELAL